MCGSLFLRKYSCFLKFTIKNVIFCGHTLKNKKNIGNSLDYRCVITGYCIWIKEILN